MSGMGKGKDTAKDKHHPKKRARPSRSKSRPAAGRRSASSSGSRSPSPSDSKGDSNRSRSVSPQAPTEVAASPRLVPQEKSGDELDYSEDSPIGDTKVSAKKKSASAIPINYVFPPEDDNNGNNRPEPVDDDLSLNSVGGLTEQVKFMKDHILYTFKQQRELKDQWGYEPEKGIIFHGPPGTGKTLLAKAFAAEINKDPEYRMTFFMRKGTDCFNMFVGETERALRELFAKAKAAKPSIIFFDEMDGLCPSRVEGQHQFYSNVVTTLLGEIDAVKRGEVFLIGATNRLEAIDPAIRRPGRLGKQLAFQPPNHEGREQILGIHLAGWKKKPSKAEPTFIAKQTAGYTGADLEQLCRHAFNCARDRMSKKNNLNLDQLEVIHEDWVSAINTTKRSNSNVFGNAFFSGQDLSETMKPLLNGIKSEIQTHLECLYTSSSQFTESGQKLMHVWNDSLSNLATLNCHIIPAVLAGIDPDKVPAFNLSLSSIPSFNPHEYLKQFFNQVNTCFKNTVVIFMPSVDKLWGQMDARAKDIFISQLESLRGKGAVLLTTANSDLTDIGHFLQFVERRSTIQQSYAMRAPTQKEVTSFFEPLLSPNAVHFGGNARTNKKTDAINELLKQAGCLATGKSLASIFDLHATISLICNKSLGKTDRPNPEEVGKLVGKMTQALDYFKKNN